MPQPDFETLRERMVRDQLAARDITDPRVLDAMRCVPRHRFVPLHLRSHAYEDNPLPIGSDQTISQPYIVALMTQLLEIRPHETILEIGTGSGYQTAVLCELAHMVYSLERHQSLADEAQRRLADLGYHNVEVFVGDGSQGFPDMAPFNGILAAAAAPAIPGPLQTQLADGGRLVIPIGDAKQQTLQCVRRQSDTWHVEEIIPVMFVPLFGRYGFKDDSESNE